MKKIFFILLVFVSFHITAQVDVTDKEFKEIFFKLLNDGSTNFDNLYDGVLPTNEPFRDEKTISLEKFFGSNSSTLVSTSQEYPHLAHTTLFVSFAKSSVYKKQVDIKKIKVKTINLFDSLSKLSNYKLEDANNYMQYTKNIRLTKNGILLASYHDRRKGSPFYAPRFDGDFCIIFYEQPRTQILADETNYNGVLPTAFVSSTAPQVYVNTINKDGKVYTEKYNGIFTLGGFLKAGTKTYYGYGPLYDGTWYSENWEYGVVKFVPEGTTDIVCGVFKNISVDVDDFKLLDYFAEKFKSTKIADNPAKYRYSFYTDYNCNWVKNIYMPRKNALDAKQKIIDDKRIKEVEISNAQYRRDHPEVSASSNQVATMPCPACNSTGKVIDKVVTDTRYETTHYKTCPRCGGSGQCVR